MPSTIIDIDQTLDPSGGANDSATESYSVHTDTGAFQWSVAGASTSVDVAFETRLGDRFGWQSYGGLGASAIGSGTAIEVVDLAPLSSVRVRIVNNDGTAGNTADVDAVVVTP